MADSQIERRHLVPQLKNVTDKDWIKAAKRLGFYVTQSSGGTSHFSIRNKNYPETDFQRNFVITIYEGMNHRRDMASEPFRALLKHGISEDEVWEALRIS